ncbi:SDR family oxidoreductase [Rhodohalobacter sp. 8-1]|uniref:SDR family oxidoreductase n=1 Tax=Rhodohalobacter sp. 8-1 TaxID=3131972 RepID=UPI0030EF6884
MIAVTGATGTIGSELIRLLSESGVEAKALSRNPPRKSELPNITWVECDLEDPDSLRDAFSGCDKLFLLTGNTEKMVTLQTNAIEAANKAGIKHVVKLSALGASEHSKSIIGVWHYIVEEYLKESGLGWTMLRPHVYMQNLIEQEDSINREDGMFYSPSGDAKIPLIDTRDISLAAKEILSGGSHSGETYTLSGPEAISYHDCAAVLSDVLAHTVEYVPESFDDAWTRMRDQDFPIWLISGQLALAEYHREGKGTQIITDSVKEITGQEPRSFEAFAKDYFGDLEWKELWRSPLGES